ncbi:MULTISPECIES: hypothetical protein [unclassified Mesorhizobium]|uniref:hypothetical protein n=1 Tax=unclassified Mesorhizobium TaxID=325217 RepID=UPI001FEE9CB2|nr:MULTISPECIES: hypothetical protein [unclassified Mesorhizobium]
MKLDLSPTSWGRVIAVTAAGTAFFIAVAFFVDSFNFPCLSSDAVRREELTHLLLPLMLGGSFLFFLMWKIRQLAIAQRDPSVIAAADSLTAVLNRGASMLPNRMDRSASIRRKPRRCLRPAPPPCIDHSLRRTDRTASLTLSCRCASSGK